MKLDQLRVLRTGAFGVEFSLAGFGWGKDLFHRYLKLGLVTFYVSSQRLDRVLGMWRAARNALRGRG